MPRALLEGAERVGWFGGPHRGSSRDPGSHIGPPGCAEPLFPVHRLELTEGILGNTPFPQEPGETAI